MNDYSTQNYASNPSVLAKMHMQDPFSHGPVRTPSRFQQKTGLITVTGSKLIETNAAGAFHAELLMYGLEDTNDSINASNGASHAFPSTFNGSIDVSSDNVSNIRSAAVPSFNNAGVLKKITSAALKVKYIGREDARSGIFYGYTIQYGTNETTTGNVLTLDNAKNHPGFCSVQVANGLINAFTPARESQFDWADNTLSVHSPAPRVKVVGIGLPGSSTCVQIDYSYTLEFIPIDIYFDKYELQYSPMGELGGQGALNEYERCRPLYLTN